MPILRALAYLHVQACLSSGPEVTATVRGSIYFGAGDAWNLDAKVSTF